MKYDVNSDYYDLMGKYVRVVDDEGIVYEGRIMMMCRADENDEGEESIGIITNMVTRTGTELFRHEIVSIEILDKSYFGGVEF